MGISLTPEVRSQSPVQTRGAHIWPKVKCKACMQSSNLTSKETTYNLKTATIILECYAFRKAEVENASKPLMDLSKICHIMAVVNGPNREEVWRVKMMSLKWIECLWFRVTMPRVETPQHSSKKDSCWFQGKMDRVWPKRNWTKHLRRRTPLKARISLVMLTNQFRPQKFRCSPRSHACSIWL